MTSATAAPAPAAPAGVHGNKLAGAAPPGAGPPGSSAFASELDQHVARTATAEGQTKTARATSGLRSHDVKRSGADDDPAALVAAVAPPANAAAGVAAPTPATVPPAGPNPAPADPATPSSAAASLTPAPSVPSEASLTAAPPAAATAPATAMATAPAPDTGSPPAPAAAPQSAGDPVAAALHALSGGGQPSAQSGSGNGGTRPDGRGQPAEQTHAIAAATVKAAHAAAGAVASAPSGAAAADASVAAGDVSPTAPSSTPATAAPAPTPAPVNLQRTVDAVTATIELATRQGQTQARIQLTPPSLGTLNIHLQKTPDGLVARVVADHSAAAQTLQQGADDLRRSLESTGMTLLRLDIETSGQGTAQAGQDPPAGTGNGSTATSSAEPASPTTEEGASLSTTIDLGTTTLVNVLA